MRSAYVLAITVALVLISLVQAGMYSSSDPITVLTDANFDSLVTKGNEVWAVEFYSDGCGHCHAFKDAWLAAAKAMKGVARFGVVDGASQGGLAGRFGVQGFPTVKIFGLDRVKPVEYQEAREAKPLSQAVLKEVRNMVSLRLNPAAPKDTKKKTDTTKKQQATGEAPRGGKVVELTGATFKSETSRPGMVWIIAFKAKWCGHCQRLVPEFETASRAFQANSPVRFATVECPDHQSLCQDFGVKGYPTIKVFSNSGSKVEDYNGAREERELQKYMKGLEAKIRPTPKPAELVQQDQLDGCVADGAVCVFASFPDIRDSSVAERQKYIQLLTDAAAKTKQYTINWVYSFARAHRDLENNFNMGQNGFPSIVLIHKGKSIYSPLFRAFTLDNIVEWASAAGNNKVTSAIGYSSIPKLDATVQPWDGKEFVVGKDEL